MRGNTQLGHSCPMMFRLKMVQLKMVRKQLDYFVVAGADARRLRLLGNDEVFYFGVSCLRDDLPMDEIQFRAIRTSSDDFLGNSVADAGQSFELIGGRRVDVELGGGCRLRRGGCAGVRRRDRGQHQGREQQKQDLRDHSQLRRLINPSSVLTDNRVLATGFTHKFRAGESYRPRGRWPACKLRCDCSLCASRRSGPHRRKKKS